MVSRSSSRSASRSRSRSRDRRPARERDRRSRTPKGRAAGYRRKTHSRSHSRSPLSDRRRHVGSRDNPPESSTLGIFGLSTRTSERDLREIFNRYPGYVDVKLINDYGSGLSRGFGFITFESNEDARYVKDKCVGMDIDGRNIRIDYSTTSRAHTPTPGKYMGRPTVSRERRDDRRDDRRRSPNDRSSRYRSRSRSPRRSYSRSPRRRSYSRSPVRRR